MDNCEILRINRCFFFFKRSNRSIGFVLKKVFEFNAFQYKKEQCNSDFLFFSLFAKKEKVIPTLLEVNR